jgi:gluconate 2-dehydrogenase gamma chain
MPLWLSEGEYAVVAAACERLIPGGADGGCADYVDGLLGAFTVDPPRIWAVTPRGDGFHPLGRLDELAWRTRIEGSQGMAEREFNGPVTGLQERYRRGLDALGADFVSLSAEDQDARLKADPEFTTLLYHHACEGMYGPPAYGGNRELAGWQAIDFPGDVQPVGYPDEEVAGP